MHLIICGDFNGHIGTQRGNLEKVLGEHCIEDRNEDGRRIVDFAIINSMAIINTVYEHRESQTWTWYRCNEARLRYTEKSMIDLFLTNDKTKL